MPDRDTSIRADCRTRARWSRTRAIGRVGLALMAVLVIAAPALAGWEFERMEHSYGDVQQAYLIDSTRSAQLLLTCRDNQPNAPEMMIHTTELWDDTASYASEVPLTLTFGGMTTGVLAAHFLKFGDRITVLVLDPWDANLRAVFSALAKNDGPIVVQYFDHMLSFDGTGAAAPIRQLLTACDATHFVAAPNGND